MPSPVKTFLERPRLYLERLERDIAAGERTLAMADAAELGEIAKRLWVQLERTRL